MIAGIAVFAAAACSQEQDAATPEPTIASAQDFVARASTPTSGAVAVDFETCEGFLDAPPPDMVSSTIELSESAKKDNPSIVSMCAISHQTLDRTRGMTLTVIKFDSVGAAESRFDLMRQGMPGDVAVGSLGPRSYEVVVDSGGVGSFVVFQKGVNVISVHTAMPEGETPVQDVDELASIAKMVNAKLP